MLKRFQEYFEFSKKELNGLLVLCILIVLVAFTPLVCSSLHKPKKYDNSAFEKEIQKFKASAIEYERADKYLKRQGTGNSSLSAVLFLFNPNNLPADAWRKLGLSEKQIKVIKNYESKGGKFYRKEDLKRIYSISEADYSRLEPFIDIPRNENKHFEDYKREPYKKRDRISLPLVDINTADSAQFETLNGIGAAFASRIVKYRNKLGGFYKKEQLKEVYGLDSALYQRIESRLTINDVEVKLIPINSNDFNSLKHPYLTYKQINAIIKYRRQHGPYKSPEDLKKIVLLDDAVLNRIRPYLSFAEN